MRAALAFCVAVCAVASAQAQAILAPPPSPRSSDRTTALAQLAEIMGEAHYIRRLCYGRGDQRWRDQMMHFMDLEGPQGTPERKAMSDGFNAGYRSQEERFPACSPEAQNYEASLNAKGARLANAMAARYRD